MRTPESIQDERDQLDLRMRALILQIRASVKHYSLAASLANQLNDLHARSVFLKREQRVIENRERTDS